MGRHNRQKNTVVVVVQEQGFVPIRMVCPYCHSKVLTEIRYKDGLLTYILCCGLVLFGCWLGCCLIPFCVPSLKDVEHYCPECGELIYTTFLSSDPAPPTVIVTQPIGLDPVQMKCPSCQANIVTDVHYENGLLTYILSGGLCLLGCWLGCCLIPLCVDSCKDVDHYCPLCRTLIHKTRRL
uniref:Lipopolysaccharide-induced tumor necrosis factor-alpha factor homolog n=1 Tax=Dermatophagoides pteronyssinus TaxID=6956 RepID=A0A6P6YE95_DERPT|nr:lipopolysaccharide-induced tumor necrosis factor-alpha factor homolog [Dermatophagoides pteronyssinus]